jgi:hypothetical protein
MNKQINLDLNNVTLGNNFLSVSDSASQQDLAKAFNTLAQTSGSSLFWLGDLLAASEAKFGDKYTLALAKTNYAYQTLREAKSVCSRFPASKRLPLSYAHHKDAIKLTKDVTLAVKFLGVAQRESLPVSQLRKMIKLELNPRKDEEKVTADFVNVEWITVCGAFDTLDLHLGKKGSKTLQIEKTIILARLNSLLTLANNI